MGGDDPADEGEPESQPHRDGYARDPGTDAAPDAAPDTGPDVSAHPSADTGAGRPADSGFGGRPSRGRDPTHRLSPSHQSRRQPIRFQLSRNPHHRFRRLRPSAIRPVSQPGKLRSIPNCDAVMLHRFSLEQADGGWTALGVLDI